MNGTSQASISSAGQLNCVGIKSSGNAIYFGANTFLTDTGLSTGVVCYRLTSNGINGAIGRFAIRFGATSSSPDCAIESDSSGVIAVRSGVIPQTFRVYNTYTDASNYERGFLQWNSGVFEIGTEGSGTGSEQPVRITAATLNIPNLPTYADDAAAGTGGLAAGDVYKTSTGELRIKL